MIALNKLTLRLSLLIGAMALLFGVFIPLSVLVMISQFHSVHPNSFLEKNRALYDLETDRMFRGIQAVYILTGGAALAMGGGLMGYVKRIERRMAQISQTFETQIEVQARQLTMFNEFFTREVADHQRDQLEFQLINRIFEQSLEGIIISDGQGNILKINPTFSLITGYSEEECLGQNPRMLQSGIHNESFYREMWASLHGTGHWEHEIWNRRKSGEAYPQWLSISAIRDERGEITHYIAVFYDITELKHSQRQIAHQTHHDALTGLPNRLLFQDHLDMAIAQAQRHNSKVGVIFLDLDRFKQINDSLGYTVGDILLQEVAKRLKNCCRRVDTVARLGGDEFMIVLPDLHDNGQEAIEVAERILDALAHPFSLKEQEIISSASLGLTMYPTDGKKGITLEKNADIAMNKAKEQGRNTYVLYTQTMQDSIIERLELERNLRHALKNDEFVLHYQPQVDIRSGEIIGMEALVRWQKSEGQLIPPDVFIPLAEENGMIAPLGEWVLHTACRQANIWRQAGFDTLTVAVNLSAKQFQDERLIQIVRDVLEETGLPPEALRLEITEHTVMKDIEKAITMMIVLRNIGVRLSIDDFGTGYSSLHYLRSFPLDEIKIDKSFVKDIPTRRDDVAIAKAIFSLAHSLDMKVLAEGVETLTQFEFMRDHKCDGMQGYLFSKPVSAEEFTVLLEEGRKLKI